MICELCGKQLIEGFQVNVEGTRITACQSCSKHKKVINEVKKPTQKPRATPKRKVTFDVTRDYDLVDGYGKRIKNAREKKNMTQDDLGKKLNESHSLVHRIELEKYEPSTDLAKKFEKALGITILEAHKEMDEQQKVSEKKELTLGDMIVIRKKEK